MAGLPSSGHNSMITPHLSDQADKLKDLIQRDDERRRQQFIRNLSEKHNDNIAIATREDVAPAASMTPNHTSIEHQLQQQVNFYENAIAGLQKRTDDISVVNNKLYEKMNKSVIVEDNDSSDEELIGKAKSAQSHRPKERLLRTKAEFESVNHVRSAMDIEDSLTSIDESGQVTVEMDYKLFPREMEDNDMLDMADLSLGSEPGQVTGIVNNFVSRDDIPKKVTFDVDKQVLSATDTKIPDTNCDEMKPIQSMSNSRDNDHQDLNEEMKSVQDLYETKTKHLQLLLHTGRKQLEEQQTEIKKLRAELRMYKTPVKDGSVDDLHCNCNKTYVTQCEKKLVRELLLERDELFEAIKRQQCIVAEGNRHETEAYYQVKKSCELVEQVHLEKQDAVVRVKQLEKDIEGYKERYHMLQKTNQEDISNMSDKIKQEHEAVVDELNNRIEEQTMSISLLENQLEKCAREKKEVKSELHKFGIHTASQLAKSNAMFEGAQKEVMDALKRQTLAEHETGQVRLDMKLKEKRKQQEVDQLSLEVHELKRRLHTTEQNLTQSQKSEIELTNQLNSCKQQFQAATSHQALMMNTFEEKRKRFEKETSQREQDLTDVIHERDKYYELAKEELTRLLDSQTHIVGRYQNECKELNERLCNEQKQRQLDVVKLTDKCHELEECLNRALDKEEKNEVILHSYKQQLESSEHELKEKKEMVMILMSKQSAILRDRYLLSKEVELLKSQLHTA